MEEIYDDLTFEEAIVFTAAEDYKKALLLLKKNPESKFARREVKELEDYFHSPDFEDLTNLNPDYLIRKIKEFIGGI